VTTRHSWSFGVATEDQRRGIGRALLRPILERAEADVAPCCAETQTEGNVAFHRECGLGVIAERSEPVRGLPIRFVRR
jgi:ribosomal protein S18 acetylase RimI-like enzyme